MSNEKEKAGVSNTTEDARQDRDLGTTLKPQRDEQGKPGSYHNDPNGQKGGGPANDR
ncbi:hypothetical protein [Pseudomonas mangiferae]|uniref:hypothetical protein n=1 Tax=Pseudomonas mangiferae TaxID=2593654 RepID=UPI0015B61FF1|nr:hypothetical protein [Pseudomonas mangiferae]